MTENSFSYYPILILTIVQKIYTEKNLSRLADKTPRFQILFDTGTFL